MSNGPIIVNPEEKRQSFDQSIPCDKAASAFFANNGFLHSTHDVSVSEDLRAFTF